LVYSLLQSYTSIHAPKPARVLGSPGSSGASVRRTGAAGSGAGAGAAAAFTGAGGGGGGGGGVVVVVGGSVVDVVDVDVVVVRRGAALATVVASSV
jgi:hypothetical protein